MLTPAVAPTSQYTLSNWHPKYGLANINKPVPVQDTASLNNATSFAQRDKGASSSTDNKNEKFRYANHILALGVGVLGILYPKKALGAITYIPKAIINLPQTIQNSKTAFLAARPKKFAQYYSLLSEPGQMIKILPTIDLKYKNLSINDVSTRLGILGVYIPQGIMAIHYKRHPFETWVRNILAWFGTNVILQSVKDPQSYYSSFMNQFLVPKKKFSALKGKQLSSPSHLIDRFLNTFRTDWNYLSWMEKAGISLKSLGVKEDISKAVYKEAFWNKLDVNELRLLENTAQRLLKKHQMYGPRPLLAKQANQIASFLKRCSSMRYFSNISMAAAQTLLIGVLAPIITFALTHKLDERFERPVKRYYLNNDGSKEPLKTGGKA